MTVRTRATACRIWRCIVTLRFLLGSLIMPSGPRTWTRPRRLSPDSPRSQHFLQSRSDHQEAPANADSWDLSCPRCGVCRVPSNSQRDCRFLNGDGQLFQCSLLVTANVIMCV